MKPKVSLAIVAVLGILWVAAAALTHNRSVSASTAHGADRLLTIGGTGILRESHVKDGEYQMPEITYYLDTPSGEPMVLGTVDSDTLVHNRALGLAPDSSIDGTAFRHFLGKRMTVIAEVDARLDAEKVFVPTHARHILFLTGTKVE